MDEVRSRVVDLDLNDVLPNRFQPRIKFSEDSIIELSESIKEHGVIQPIVVRPIGDKYEIIAGERRYKASVLAGKESIPAIITDLNDKDSAEVALIENVQRKDLTAIEEAISYKKILDMGYLTQEQLAIKLGKSQSTVANKIRLLNLCDEVQEALMEDKISERHARSMLKLTTAENQRIMLDKIINERLTVRKTDEEIEKMNTYITNPIDVQPEQPVNNPGFVDVDKIANNAQDLKFEDPSGNVNMNALLQGNGGIPTVNPAESTIPVIPAVESAPVNNIFNNNQMVPPVDLMAPAEPTAPVTPVIEPVPTVDSFVPEPVVPVVPEIPAVPLMDPIIPAVPVVEPVSTIQPAYDLPPVPLVDPFSANLNPTAPVTPVIEPVPTVDSFVPEPVVPVVPEVIPAVPVVEPVPTVDAYVPEPVMPIVPEVQPIEPVGNIFNSAPTITPIVPEQSISNIAPMPTTPIVEEALPPKFLGAENNGASDVVPEEQPSAVGQQPVTDELAEAEAKLEEKTDEIRPIIITDYSKQYDPILPEAAPTPEKVDFKQIINLIRDVNSTIEKCGYTVETEEYDLEGVYQVIFKINKN